MRNPANTPDANTPDANTLDRAADVQETVFDAAAASFGRPGFATDGRLSLGVAVLGVLVAAAMALVFIVTLQSARSGALEAARISVSNLARVMADGAARSMESVDVALTLVAEAAGPALAAGAAPAGEIDRRARDGLAATPVLRQIVLCDAKGVVLYDSAGRLTPGAQLPLEIYQDGEDATRRALTVGLPEDRRFIGGGPAAGQRLIPVLRRIEAVNGAPAGWVLGAVNPLHFLTVASSLDLGEGGWAALYRFDGLSLAGGSGAPIALSVAAALARREETGVRVDEMSDGVERIAAYRATPVWPLVLEVGVAKDAALEQWRRSVVNLAPPVGAAGLAVLGLAAALARALRRRGRDQAALLLSDNALRSVRGGVAIADLRAPGRPIIYYNAAMSAILGASPERFPASGASAGLMSGVGDGASLLRSLAAGAGRYPAASPIVRRALRRGGEIVWVDVALTWVSVSGGAPTHVVIAFNDVSEQVAAEQELLRSLEETAQLHDEQSHFCEILAHHLQEPVRRVVAHAQLLRRAQSGLSAEAEQALCELESSGRRLRALLRDVELYMSAGVLTPSHGVASADAALSAALHRLRRSLEESGAQLLRNPLPTVGMAMGPLTEVLFALIDNALTHSASDRPPVILIDATARGADWVICVEDNGLGIERAYFERIFKVFERLNPGAGAEPNSAAAGNGTGIGLALARKLVERAGGRIWLESEPGLGSRFFVALPAADAPLPAPCAPVSSPC